MVTPEQVVRRYASEVRKAALSPGASWVTEEVIQQRVDGKTVGDHIGFKPFRPENVERQAATYVIGEFFKRHFDYEKTADALGKKIPSLNPELAGHYQDVMWAIDDLRDKQYEALLPPR